MRVRSRSFFLRLAFLVVMGVACIYWRGLERDTSLFLTREDLAFSHLSANTEWLDLSGEIFFRLNTAHYLADLRRVLIFATCPQSIAHNLDRIRVDFQVEVFHSAQKSSTFHLSHVERKLFLDQNPVANVELSAHFDLGLQTMSSTSLNLIIRVKNKKSEAQSPPLKLIIKNRTSLTPAVYICGHTNFLEEKDYANHKWWVDLNALIGYDKIVIYNNSVPNTASFQSLYARHSSQVEIVAINYLPNLVKKGRIATKYFRHMEELTKTGAEYSADSILYWNIIYMTMNECLLSYSDKARRLLVIDNDEVFIPPKLRHFENDHRTFSHLVDLDLSTETKVDFIYLFFVFFLLSNVYLNRNDRGGFF